MEKINFLASDGVELTGILYKSKIKTKRIILAVHGMSSDCFRERDDVIAKEAKSNKIDYFCFNNRGSFLSRYIRKEINGKQVKQLGGTSYEDISESYFDIVGAIEKLIELGYENIYLQGHSLGCTKIVYTYNKLIDENNSDLLKKIEAIILLSLIDIPTVIKVFLGDKYEQFVLLAEDKVKQGNELEIMPKESFIHPVCAKTFLQYAKNYENVDIINSEKDKELKKLNKIDIPIFMRWGSENEMILEKADKYSNKINNLIKNKNKDINYINGANHGYQGKEEILAKQIINFLK